MKNIRSHALKIANASILTLLCANAWGQNTLPSGAKPTGMTITNASKSQVFANIVLGQPPVTPPTGCSSLGKQIVSLTDPNLVFVSSVRGKKVVIKLVAGVTDKGSYRMAAGETITYRPKTVSCGTSGNLNCSAAVTVNYFFTSTDTGFSNNNGCSNSGFPNASNLAEVSINFGINGSVGASCANADDTDISAVNGVNAILKITTHGTGWPAPTRIAQNSLLGQNANLPGVFGWAATNCAGNSANAGYPNPSASCAAPKNAPRVPVGKNATCKTPKGLNYAPIAGPSGILYCDERSDTGTCNNQRDAYTTGGNVQIVYVKQAYPSP